ncbi:zinc finger MYM-type protein 1-like [Coffea eugenioides]|uniref:zinc finger MYM-type protein 1-like n=1 Tax=Coffea eugenioides TaxID=49369 RepID=UPI000F604F02|nr:zinc finger MYM-type protein 1-like [Coffea eugenioides]
MAIVLRFVDKQGYIRERFFDIVHAHETNSLTLKKEICDVLSRHNLSVQNIRGQGYDGASNMHGEWNGLQALFIQECPYAYYIHCFAHRLQLTLVATSQEGSESDWYLITARDYKMGSHFSCICSLFTEYEDICSVLIDVINYGNTSTQRSEAHRVYDFIASFDFVFVMHMMRDILGFAQVEEEFENKMIQLHYRIDVFLATVDSQILEMKNRFKEDVIELLILSSALHPKDNFQAFNIERICQLANKFYSANFTNQEKLHLRTQLELFQIEFSCNSQLQNLSSLQELCQVLAKTRKSMCYTLIDRLIRLILTLPVSTTTTERAFSAMKMIKTCLHSRMEEDFLANSMIMYIEKEIARTFDINSIIDDFDKIKSRRAQFHMSHTVK